eukprot:522365_1
MQSAGLLFDTTSESVDLLFFTKNCKSRDTISLVFDVLGIAINSIALMIVLTIAITTIRKLRTRIKINNILKWIFYFSVIGCLTFLGGTIYTYVFCFIDELSYSTLIIQYITFFAYFLYIDCILATLVVRLYLTFKGSMYEMSNVAKNTFIALSTIIGLLFVAILCMHMNTSFIWITMDSTNHWYIVWCLFLAWFLSYFICAVSAVYIFCSNLLSLTLRQIRIKCRNVLMLNELNSSQQKMVNMASKCVGLFVIAISSSIISIICHFLSMLELLPWKITSTIFGIDCSVNVICICLQFSFATNYYVKWCKCVDVGCRRLMTNNTIKSISEIRSRSKIKKDGYDGCPTTELENNE